MQRAKSPNSSALGKRAVHCLLTSLPPQKQTQYVRTAPTSRPAQNLKPNQPRPSVPGLYRGRVVCVSYHEGRRWRLMPHSDLLLSGLVHTYYAHTLYFYSYQWLRRGRGPVPKIPPFPTHVFNTFLALLTPPDPAPRRWLKDKPWR